VDGAAPHSGLIQAADGNFYGTTEFGGTNDPCFDGGGEIGCGTVFGITASGTLKTLYSFCVKSGCVDGELPTGGLTQGTDGNFYGTTWTGTRTTPSYGTVFKIGTSRSGTTLTTLHTFCSSTRCADGYFPLDGLLQATSGNFYGTTESGGANNDGTVFSLSVGLVQFVEALTYSGKVGDTIEFIGQGFKESSTTVSFGTAKGSNVVVPPEYPGTYLTVTVPNGATTGFVTVTTSGLTLKSTRYSA